MNTSALRRLRLPLTVFVSALVVVALLLLPDSVSGFGISVDIDAGGTDNEFTEGDAVPFKVVLTLELDEILGASVTADLTGPGGFSRTFTGIPIGDDGTTFGPSTATSDVLVLATPTADTTLSGTVTLASIAVDADGFGYSSPKFGYKGIVDNASISIDGTLLLPSTALHGDYTLTFTVDNGLGPSFEQSESVTLTILDSLDTTLPVGWTTFSIPIAAANSKFFAENDLGTGIQDGLVDPANVEQAFRFDAASKTFQEIILSGSPSSTQVANSDPLQPTEVVLVLSSASHDATLIFQTVQTNPPSRVLPADWNLVGLAVPLGEATKQVDEALISIFLTPSGLVGYDIVVSPPINADPFVWTRGESPIPNLTRSRGYWVFMENEDTLAGFSTTPVES